MNRILPGLTWLILWILSWLPGFIMRFFSWLIWLFVWQISRYRYEVVKTNLSRSLPELSTIEHHKIAADFYRHFCDLFLETIILLRLKARKESRHIRIINPELLNESLQRGQNIIIMTGHFGNWEWNLPPLLESGYRVIAVYKPQNSRYADQLMMDIRQKPGVLLVSMKDTMRVISKELAENNGPFALYLAADQTPPRVDIRFWTEFLNQETGFFTGGEKLGRKFHFPVYYIDQHKLGFGRYEARIAEMYDGYGPTQNGDITRTFITMLEESIRKEPYLWLWSHRRWKYHREELPLPL